MSASPRQVNYDRFASISVAAMPVVLCLLKCDSPEYESEKNTIEQLSQEYSGRVRFAVIDPWEMISVAEQFDVDSLPALVLIDGMGSDRGLYWGEFDKLEIREHLEKWITNSCERR